MIANLVLLLARGIAAVCRRGLAARLGAALLPLLAAGAAQAANLNFDGSQVNGCQLQNNVYTCSNFPLSGSTDAMTIASGYTVNVQSSATFSYNQSLVMSGTAQLNVTGNLDIAGVATSNLKVSGGTLVASGNFVVGNQAQTLTADVQAATMTIGSGSQLSITGKLTATGAVTFGSHATLNGSVSGSTIATNSPVTLNANVTASTSFTLASGSTVSGNVTAPTVSMLPSGSTITGAISASSSLTVGSGNTINGNVSAGTLVMQNSNSALNGNATVADAQLGYGDSVNAIYCTSAPRADGTCSCVSVNHGSYGNMACNAPPQPPVAPATLHHFQITHDGTASACTPETVKVEACADAACTTYYKGGVTGTVTPGGTFRIDTTGTPAQATVTQNAIGSVTLAIASSTPAAPNAATCVNSAANSSSCAMQFNGNVGLALTMADQRAEEQTAGILKSTVYNPANQSCGPGFVNVTKPVQMSCKYINPAGGSLPVRIAPGSNPFVALNGAASATAACDTGGASVQVGFDANGQATLNMLYADVGAVRLDLSTPNNGGTASTSLQVVVAPYAYGFGAIPATVTAGLAQTVTVKALNKAGATTPNFGRESANPAISPESLVFGVQASCLPSGYTAPTLGVASQVVSSGVTSANLTYAEAGDISYTARQASSNYLSGTVAAPAAIVSTGSNACGSTRSVPAYFDVVAGASGPPRAPTYFYSGQPIDATVTARNYAGAVTAFYDAATGYSKAVNVTVIDSTGKGTASPGVVAAATFASGVGFLKTAASVPTPAVVTSPALTYTFTSAPTVPTPVTLRATESAGASPVSSLVGTTEHGATIEMRSGRLRIGSSFGTAQGDLDLPVTVEYYTTSKTWLRSVRDTYAAPIPAGAFGVLSQTTNWAAPTVAGPVAIVKGMGTLKLHPPGGKGTALIMLNLGNGITTADKPDVSCIPVPTPGVSAGAAAPWLRAPNGVCGSGKAGDPLARATFGVTTPETRRVIHVREVFN